MVTLCEFVRPLGETQYQCRAHLWFRTTASNDRARRQEMRRHVYPAKKGSDDE